MTPISSDDISARNCRREESSLVEHPHIGEITLAGHPIKMSAAPARIRKTGPRLGEDAEALLAELGLSPRMA